MPALAARTRSRLLRCAALAVAVAVSGSGVQASAGGFAYVTSTQGLSRGYVASDAPQHYRLHQTYPLSPQRIHTSAESHLFFALSNGVGLGIAANTQLEVIRFEQQPYSSERESLEFEPSVSQLALKLSAGRIALASGGLSPSSELYVHTPLGTLRLHSGRCQIEIREQATYITTYQGNLTFSYDHNPQRIFLPLASQLVLTATGPQPTPTPLSELPEGYHRFATAAERARQRAHFKAPQVGQPPAVIRIADPQYFEQAPARPYTYRAQ